jgi:hypothetical protein
VNEETGDSRGPVWSGQWVADRLGVRLDGDEHLAHLLGLALRQNPRRAHLLVSNVLGKHIPQRPHIVYGAGVRLGERVRDLLGDRASARAVVLGYAETATGLGHSVADGLALAPYLHSTRRPVPDVASLGAFEEEHSHATSHLLLPEDAGLLSGDGPLVLVDDEFSTGRTVLNTIKALHGRYPRDRYVIVALADMRSAEDRARLETFAADLGTRVDLVATAAGTVRLPADVLARGQALVAEHEAGHHTVAEPLPAASAGAAAPYTRASGRGERTSLAHLERVDLGWPDGVPDGGRHGFTPAHRAVLESALPHMTRRIAEALRAGMHRHDGLPVAEAPCTGEDPYRAVRAVSGGGRPEAGLHRVLVLGCEELMYAPLRLAHELDRILEAEVRFSTTTRSPVLAVDDPGYAIRTRLVFRDHDAPADGPGPRYAYNVAGGDFDAIVTVVDSTADTPELHAPGGLLTQLAAHTGRLLLAVVPSYLPEPQEPPMPATSSETGRAAAPVAPAAAGGGGRSAANAQARIPTAPATPAGSCPVLAEPLRGPDFSSYAPDEVGWLLQDFSDVQLEAPTEEREEAIQRGGAHYAESLPVEYQPSDRYQELFRVSLETSAARIARAVGTVTETVLAELPRRLGRGRGRPRPVLVSLARAGTPVGILMRRWAQHVHGLDLPHYAISIVRGRGIDATALRWLAGRHDPADVVFVDGWTGKGAITRELAQAVKEFPGFDPEIAVLADPGRCVRTYGTREDFLIPSACLNSTVSGLISRTVLRADLVGPDDFHGAKFYRELAGADVSGLFLDTVAARFEEVADDVAADVKERLAADRTPTWEGWAAVERISEEYGIHDVNLVKPGVGETTRVLLRRVPWLVLARRGAGADLDHVRLLAEQRGVPVKEVDDLPYTCVGLIHPRYTRGATGADGKAVSAP